MAETIFDAVAGSVNDGIIKYASFDVTGTTGTTARGGFYNAGVTIPSVNGTVLGVVICSTFDTTYTDRHCFATVYNNTSLTVWSPTQGRGVRVAGYILYVPN